MRQDEQASKKAEGSEKYVCLETEKSINKTHAKICNKNLRNERKDRDRERVPLSEERNLKTKYLLCACNFLARGTRKSESCEKTQKQRRGKQKLKKAGQKRRGGSREVNATVFSCSAARRLGRSAEGNETLSQPSQDMLAVVAPPCLPVSLSRSAHCALCA